jgi:hypothetical protein
METSHTISNGAELAISEGKSTVKAIGIKRAKNLVDEAINSLEFLAWFHQLLDLAVVNEGDVTEVLLDAYLPLGKCHMEEIGFKLKKIKEELNKVR